MSDEEIESEKEFPGLYASEASYKSDSDYGDNCDEQRKEFLKSKKKEKNRDKGYAALDGESSNEEMDSLDSKLPVKAKKPKSFKFLQKRDKEEKEDKKDEKKKREDKEDKKKEKKREKEEKKKEKEKKKIKKDRKKKGEESEEEFLPIFGVPLSISVERQPSHDGIRLPVVVRECIDFVEQKGLLCEGIYRLTGVKSKIQILRRAYNSGQPVELEDQNPHVIASLLKQFLRDLPETVLTVDMMPHFEDVSLIPNPKERSEAMRQLIDRLPSTNRLLLQYVLKHMGNVIKNEKENKMTYQNICIVLSPTMQISHRVLNVMFLSHSYLFGDVVLKRYIPPLTSLSGTQAIEELKTSHEIAEEINKQESLLSTLHKIIASGKEVSRANEEQLWEAQRIVTFLKRRLKAAKRKEGPFNRHPDLSVNSQDKDLSSEESQKEGSLADSKSNLAAMEDERDATFPDTKSGSDQESGTPSIKSLTQDSVASKFSGGESDKSQGGETNVNHSDMIKVDSQVSKDKVDSQVCKEESSAISVVCSSKSQTIPILPKPISARVERNKASKIKQENKMDATVKKIELKIGSEVPLCESPRRQTHVTVVRVGEPSEVPIDHGQVQNNLVNSLTSLESKSITLSYVNTSKKEIDQHSEHFSANLTEPSQDSAYSTILEEVTRLQFEHEELLAMNHELTCKLQAEKVEITRLREEIQEVQTLYGYRTHFYDSSESEGSESDGAESDSEEDIHKQIGIVNKANIHLQSENSSLAETIQNERDKIIQLRVALKQAQMKPAQNPPPTSSQPLHVY